MPSPSEITKFCFTCRRETLHRHVQAISSRTLYACTTVGCTAPHREVTDPSAIGRSDDAIAKDAIRRTRTLEDVAPDVKQQRIERESPKKETKTMAKEFSNPVQEAIAGQVKEQLKNLVTKEEFDEFVDKMKSAATPKELDQHVGRILEKQLPELINAALLQLLAAPKKTASNTGGGSKKTLELNGPCPRAPHKGNCPSAWCVNAEKRAAAEAAESDE